MHPFIEGRADDVAPCAAAPNAPPAVGELSVFDEAFEAVMVGGGELGGVGQLLAGELERGMNDNVGPPREERLIGRTLASAVAIESHLTEGMDAMLSANGCTENFCEVMREFLRPVVALLADIESDVIRESRLLAADTIAGRAAELEGFADEFERLARGPRQTFLAASFKEFVAEAAGTKGKEAQQQKEPTKGKDHALERD